MQPVIGNEHVHHALEPEHRSTHKARQRCQPDLCAHRAPALPKPLQQTDVTDAGIAGRCGVVGTPCLVASGARDARVARSTR